jgi:hypothetical protein
MTWLEDPSWMEGEKSLLLYCCSGLLTWSWIIDSHTLMPIASLETSLERVDTAVASLPQPT